MILEIKETLFKYYENKEWFNYWEQLHIIQKMLKKFFKVIR